MISNVSICIPGQQFSAESKLSKKTKKCRSFLQNNKCAGNQCVKVFSSLKILKYEFTLPLLNTSFLLVSFVDVYVYICVCVVHISRQL